MQDNLVYNASRSTINPSRMFGVINGYGVGDDGRVYVVVFYSEHSNEHVPFAHILSNQWVVLGSVLRSDTLASRVLCSFRTHVAPMAIDDWEDQEDWEEEIPLRSIHDEGPGEQGIH